ncbi:MAG: PKD domain-containing protein [Methanoregulaceae archaeon]|nr:MAG: PKD domain-containing protein [Methanoregulaceae archaeon]
MKFSARATNENIHSEALIAMKKISVVLIIVFLVLIPVATASQDRIGTTELDMREHTELDMTGLETDIELIELDPEIIMATDDWMILVHDDAGKKSLLEDIDRFSLSDDERSDMKFAVNDLWASYPTKFAPAGEKTIEMTIQSDGSEKIISVPVGHVTKIEFDRKKIKETAQGKETPHAQMLASIKSSAKIALTENENQTIKNISGLREKLYKQRDSHGTRSSEEAEQPSVPSNSFSDSNGFSSGLSSSSSFSINQGFPSSVKKDSGSSEYGLAAWSGSPEPLKGEDVTRFHNDPALYTGHNGIMYLSCKKMGCAQVYSLNAADTAMDPDSWEPLPETCQINMVPFASIILPTVAEEKWKLLIHSCNHYYDPLVGDHGSGAAPVYVKKYSDMAKYNKTINDVESAKQLGQASHFLNDVSLPTHTGTELPQILERISEHPRDTHNWYEFYLNDLWYNSSQYKFPVSQKTIKQIIEDDSEYYSFTDPEAATKNLARFSNSYSFTLYYKIRNLPVQLDGNTAKPGTGFYADTTVERITKNQVLAAARYTNGLVRYVRNDAIKDIPIADFVVAQNPICNSPYDVLFHEKTHLTTTGAYSYKWDFGDGNTRVTGDYDFTHNYATAGVYTVSYKTWNAVNGPTNAIEKTMDVYAGACPPSAEFNIISEFGSEPYTFKFEDKSTGGIPTSWQWSFGDDTPGSNERNPTHTFNRVRQFDASLIVSNEYGDSIITKQVVILRPWAFAIVQVNKKAGYAPLTVTVKDVSSCWQTANEFDAGDGTPIVYNQTEFVHTYQYPGTFFANLTVRNDLGTNTNTTTITVTAVPPLANFTANATMGQAPLAVAFTDISTGNPTKWNWSFGDNSTSTERNPVHVYNTDGSFTVSLNATSPGGSNISTKTGYICTNCIRPIPPVADFTVNVTSGTLPLTVAFFGKTVGGPTNTWLWDFGDGQNSTLQNPVHKYNAKGNYSISLTIKNTAGTSTRVLPNWIRAGFDIITVNDTQNNSNISIAQNNIIRLELNQCTSCGYEWSLNITPGLNVINTSFLMNPTLPGVNGGSGQNVWDITAFNIGEQNITAVYKRPGIPLTGNELAFRLNITVSLPIIPLPGYSVMPTDPDSDGLYEDLNGNGRLDFADSVLYFNQMTWISANEPIAAFDLNRNGRIDFADIVVLFNEI